MAAHAGKFPGANSTMSVDAYKAYNNSSAFKGYRGTAKDNNGLEWSLSTGWHYARQKGWRRDPLKPKSKMVINGLDGKKHKITVYGDYDDYIGFHATPQTLDDSADKTDALSKKILYAEDAFDGSNVDQSKITESAGCGHIANLRYTSREQILEVKFENKDICYFYRLPPAVAGQLLYLAKEKEKRSDGRHLLGITFWDLVRIRGHHTGARYPFEYGTKKNGKWVKHNNRHYIKYLGTDGDYKAVSSIASNDELLDVKEQLGALVPGQAHNEVRKQYKKDSKGNTVITAENAYTTFEEDEINRIMNKGKEGEKETAAGPIGLNIRKELSMVLQDKMRKMIGALRDDADFSADVTNMIINMVGGVGNYNETVDEKYRPKAEWEVIKQNAGQYVEGLRFNHGQLQVLDPTNEKQLAALTRAVYGSGPGRHIISSWKHKNAPGEYNLAQLGKVWSKNDLVSVADKITDLEAHRRYKQLIESNNWRGALNLLKNTVGEEHKYIDKQSGRTISFGKKYIASNYDEFDEDI